MPFLDVTLLAPERPGVEVRLMFNALREGSSAPEAASSRILFRVLVVLLYEPLAFTEMEVLDKGADDDLERSVWERKGRDVSEG